ncbi:MAG: tRNA (cytidine(34)-2'-O)-methyltransferase [Candidatus Melainabacteria bacterium]|jgi:tRNA (cytidine/uridine-2'-O-)-methyltransferase
MLDIVLYQPEIPPNTGNIGRLCVSNDLRLHLVEPLGFEISDKQLKRSGMDYWQYLNLTIHKDWNELISFFGESRNYWFFTTKTEKSFWSAEFQENDILVFGPETRGLPEELLNQNPQRCLTIPMLGKHKRSLNLSTSAGVAVYEALRQISL